MTAVFKERASLLFYITVKNYVKKLKAFRLPFSRQIRRENSFFARKFVFPSYSSIRLTFNFSTILDCPFNGELSMEGTESSSIQMTVKDNANNLLTPSEAYLGCDFYPSC